jgi:hypothetical protein
MSAPQRHNSYMTWALRLTLTPHPLTNQSHPLWLAISHPSLFPGPPSVMPQPTTNGCHLPYPFICHSPCGVIAAPNSIAAKAACMMKTNPPPCKRTLASVVITKYLIGLHDMEVVYMSPDPYSHVFEATLDLCKCNLTSHWMGGLRFLTKNGRLILATMNSGTPGTRVNKWRTQLHGAWLISINGTLVSTFSNAQRVFSQAHEINAGSCTLLFSHPEVTLNISYCGVPVMSKEDFTQFTHD